MALFEVEGWNIKTDNVALGKVDAPLSKKKEKKLEKKNKRREALGKKKNQLQEWKEEETVHEENEQIEPTQQANDNLEESEPEVSAEETKTELTPLQQKMMAKLTGSRFRWINEKLYTISSEEALALISKQPQLFDEYHTGFKNQVQSWPENPVDVFVKHIENRSKKNVNAPGGLPGINKKVVIADMGCGEAQLALDVQNFLKKHAKDKKVRAKSIQVHSFDLKKANSRITVADVKNVPLDKESCSIVIFCLALMGTNFIDFIKEAHRLLAPNGELWIAEIKSRIDDVDKFIDALKLYGFLHKTTDDSNKMFTRFEFFKPNDDIVKIKEEKMERKRKFVEADDPKAEFEKRRSKNPEGKWLLKPCIYKRR
ncbi:25S rRNA (adenine(645)-N(1))-methyltransferase [Komagataella phaffii CBS 7435]|uniref:Ribosomal RNA-processing protein 8 n=2 Tax=Komagataella phaffii TaxID=460519 RepID=C4QY47_KOMPG|nr:Ribosomal RNA-processing protein 8 [Komagataella phaffii GS115]AOA61707.1 GQ67_01843T0 [Komagataella phaffii]CAH2446990.1 25S rRNA (adenine(645)-N(1))-methyltransferase [Komagataella phaffii CBS 7435]AOA65892.1 GQ68_01858T0 [Komagataella phaffii GS115]CAY68170.1 Ribosomal RNA-processing protein 8 [Komagataella phaffii GS115]SCV11893.1 25S rRNA (adenine(645)-N(1))-methyltransferase [Komagataella phaffii CBS 7435]